MALYAQSAKEFGAGGSAGPFRVSIGFGRSDEHGGATEASVESKSLVTNEPCGLACSLAHDVTHHCNKIGASRTDPSTPWQNRFVEVFNGQLGGRAAQPGGSSTQWGRGERFVEDHRLEYGDCRPHASLRYLTPVVVVQKWREQSEARNAHKRWTDERGPATRSRGNARVRR